MAASVSGEQALWVATVATRDLSHDPLLTFCCGHTLFNHFFLGASGDSICRESRVFMLLHFFALTS